METLQNCTIRGTDPRDRSRFCYELSASVFKPAPSDIEIDDALAGYVEKISLISGGGRGQARSYPRLYEQPDDDRYSTTSRRRDAGRISDPVYPGVYAGSVSDPRYAKPAAPRKAIEYYSKSDIDSRVSSSRRSNGGHYQRRQLDAGRQWREDDEMSVWPEDSASQVSTRVPSEAWTEQRGRPRRREGSVVSRSGMGRGFGGFSSGGGGGGQEIIYEDDEYFEQPRTPYVTKDITPYAGGRR